MGKVYRREEGRDILRELERERTRRLQLEGQVAELTEKIAKLFEEIDRLREEVTKRDEEILRLKAQINKDSTNSSKPPSSNGFKRIANNREKSGKKQGGQKGHKGTTIKIPNNLEELVKNGKAEHHIINKVAEGEAYVSDWLIDVKIVTVYREIRRAIGRPPKIEYGNKIKGLSVYLSVVGLIAVKRIGEFFHDISGGLLSVAKATVQKFTHEAAQSIDMEPLVTDLLNGSVMNVDETLVKTTERKNLDKTVEQSKGSTLSAYIRTYSNASTTVLTPNSHKNVESVEHDNILPCFFGVVVQDYEAKFLHYGTATGLCGAHLSRELKGLAQLEQTTWAQDVRQFFKEMNEQKTADTQNGILQCDSDLLREYDCRYDKLVLNGQAFLTTLNPKSYLHKILAPMVKRLLARKSEYLLFMRRYEVPYTNNQAERDLRHCKTKQKISGCYRSWQGIVDYCNLRSVVETSRKRGFNLLDSIVSLFLNVCPAGQ